MVQVVMPLLQVPILKINLPHEGYKLNVIIYQAVPGFYNQEINFNVTLHSPNSNKYSTTPRGWDNYCNLPDKGKYCWVNCGWNFGIGISVLSHNSSFVHSYPYCVRTTAYDTPLFNFSGWKGVKAIHKGGEGGVKYIEMKIIMNHV